MRRKVGVSIVKKRKDEAKQFSKVGKSLEDTKLTFVQEVLSKFKENLTEFATKHKDRINSDPEFRQQFHTMCLSAGVDPLASSKGFWSDILGIGDFYFELGVKIIQTTVRTRASNGGVMSLEDLVRSLQNNEYKKSQHVVTIEDVMRSIDKLSVLGCGFKLINKHKHPLVISVPLEINKDHEYLMSAAQDEGGFVTESLIRGMYGWSKDRFLMILNPLLMEGMVWVDNDGGSESECKYYFHSIWKSSAIIG
jgi:ESCRT-II complex subunit VPS22